MITIFILMCMVYIASCIIMKLTKFHEKGMMSNYYISLVPACIIGILTIFFAHNNQTLFKTIDTKEHVTYFDDITIYSPNNLRPTVFINSGNTSYKFNRNDFVLIKSNVNKIVYRTDIKQSRLLPFDTMKINIDTQIFYNE